MKVYVVTRGCYSDYGIEGIFSTKEKADEYMAPWEGVESGFYSDRPEIEEWELDDLKPERPVWVVGMAQDGNVPGSYIATDHSPGFIQFDAYMVELPILLWAVECKEKERAIKVVNEKRTAILAAGIWGDGNKVRELIR